jgi:hypothetical protein
MPSRTDNSTMSAVRSGIERVRFARHADEPDEPVTSRDRVGG